MNIGERFPRFITHLLVIAALLFAMLTIYVSTYSETSRAQELLIAKKRIKELEAENEKLKAELAGKK